MRKPVFFGIGPDGYDPSAPIPDAHVGVQEIGGRGRCSWDRRPLSLEDAQALRARYAAVVAQLDAEIAEASD
jgi:hypothetical protein